MAQFTRSGKCKSGKSNVNSGHWSRGGRLSNEKVSTCALCLSFEDIYVPIPECPCAAFSKSRAIISCWTSVAPS